MKSFLNHHRQFAVRFCILSILTVLLSCSSHSKKSAPEPPKAAESQGWDYEKIRQVREDERAMTPIDSPKSPEATLTDECLVVSEAHKKQAKLSGCRKLDARLGHGDQSYCCPRQVGE